VSAIESAGFRVERLDRFPFPEGRGLNPTSPHVLSVATRP
jgi:hypothetical protein